MTRRERAYRALIAAYPRPFRDQHGDCMLGTLLDGAPHRGALAELREVAALVTGGLRARGDHAQRSGRGAWRHGVAALLAPLAAVNLAVVATAFWSVQHSRGGADGVSAWWALATLAAAGLLAAVALRRRGMAIAFAVAGLIPLGYDEWLQATGRGDGDHFSMAARQGFEGPQMSPFWLFLAAVVVVASVAWSAEAAPGRPSRRLAALLGGAIATALLLPLSLHVLLALALAGAAVAVPLGGLDRRLHGTGMALWLISLPYVTVWWPPMHLGWLAAYLTVLPAIGVVAWIARRNRRRLVA